MNKYIDFVIQEDPDFPVAHVMSALYRRLHLRLAETKLTTVAAEFPRCKLEPAWIGDTLRLISDAESFEKLGKDWHRPLDGHIDIVTGDVPADCEHRKLRRVRCESIERQTKKQLKYQEKLRERLCKSDFIVRDVALKEVKQLPYILVKSASTRESFSLFFYMSDTCERESGVFNAYGLSDRATIPFF